MSSAGIRRHPVPEATSRALWEIPPPSFDGRISDPWIRNPSENSEDFGDIASLLEWVVSMGREEQTCSSKRLMLSVLGQWRPGPNAWRAASWPLRPLSVQHDLQPFQPSAGFCNLEARSFRRKATAGVAS